MDKPIKATKQQKKIVRLEKEFGPSVKAEGTSDFRESAWHKAPTPRFHFLFERKFCFRPKYTYIYHKDQEGKDRRRQLLCYVSLIRACNKVL